MAWFQNLAGKAEDLLVKFDQNAANVLSDPNQKQLDSTEPQNTDTNVIEPSQDYSLPGRSSEPDFNIQVEPKNIDNLKTWSKGSVDIDNCDIPVFNDNISVISEKSRLSDNEDSGLIFSSTMAISKQDLSSSAFGSTIECLTKKDTKSEYSGISSKSGSLQNSFIIMDDPVTNCEEKIAKLEQENEEYNQQLINMRHLYSELQNENSNLHSQLERVNETLTITQNEMEQYRARAERVLQEKEKMIKKQDTSDVATVQDQSLHFYEELKKELKAREEDYKQLLTKLSRTEHELSALQHNFMVTQKDYEIQKHVLQDTVTNERKIRATIEEEYRAKTKKLQSTLEELSQSNNIIFSKTQEIENLREQLKQRTNYVISEDVESRLQSLTQTLLSKQNTIETVITERNALRLQLEKLEKEYSKALLMQKSEVKKLDVVELDEVKSQVPQFLKISPFDAGVTRRVKHAYSCLDTVSIRTGVFLRRYPFARVFVFCYMILLHLWVLIILCTYVPTSNS